MTFTALLLNSKRRAVFGKIRKQRGGEERERHGKRGAKQERGKQRREEESRAECVYHTCDAALFLATKTRCGDTNVMAKVVDPEDACCYC